jgi:uncharacterized protein (DUF362 family)/Pyruvate/2-oxoacid:ferredoxin oxidoreductase delta subunit
MNNKVAIRKCAEYDLQEVYNQVADIWNNCEGPDVSGMRVLVKPNILIDSDPSKAICTHPVIVEAVIRLLQSKGATVLVGDSPGAMARGYNGEKSGIFQVCQKAGAEWVDFAKDPTEINLRKGKIKITSVIKEIDIIISLPKFKNHGLVYFTGAIKNTLGLVPGFTKAKQHALHSNRISFSEFLVDLNEAVMPQFFIMDGILGMEGPGPGQGIPVKMGLLLGSSNPLALDIIASKIAGYNPNDIPTNAVALSRGLWMKSAGDIIFDGPELESLVRNDFKKIPLDGSKNVVVRFLKNRIHFLKKMERRPVFVHKNCIGCLDCIKICPANAIAMHTKKDNYVILTDSKCIRCFCCSEVCQSNAVEIRRKFFGA